MVDFFLLSYVEFKLNEIYECNLNLKKNSLKMVYILKHLHLSKLSKNK